MSNLSDIPPRLPPFDWRAVYADPLVAFYEARREDALRGLAWLALAMSGPFTPQMNERALGSELAGGCVLFDDDDEVAKAEANVMGVLAPHVFGERR